MTWRVLWVLKGLGPGGAERLVVSAAGAHRLDAITECVYVLPGKDHLAGELEAAGVATRCLSTRHGDPRWPWRLWRQVRCGDWDVVHVHSPLPGAVARAAVRSLPRDRRPLLVSTEHNSWDTHRRATRFASIATSRWDDHRIAVTEEVKASMGTTGSRAVVLRHGIDVSRTRQAAAGREAMRDSLGLGSTPTFVTVANFRPQKDHPTLLRAMRLLVDAGVGARLVVVGQGPQEAATRQMAADLGVADVVLFTGFRADAVAVMAAADAFVLASRWEGLPVALMEATALGLPVVATAVGGVAEELVGGDDALLVPPGDPVALAGAMRTVVDDPELRARLAEASWRVGERFDVRVTTAAIETLYGASPDRGDAPSPVPPRPAKRPVGVEIRPAGPADRDGVLAVLRRSLGGDADPRHPMLFSWKHDLNPFGPSPMWVAVDGERVVAVRAFMRWEFQRGAETVRAVRAVDTATDPDYQGRGLFSALTTHGLAALRADGVSFVFNTPNAQSLPGYLKLGWREVGRLPVAARFVGARGAINASRSRVPADRWSLPIDAGVAVEEWLDSVGQASIATVPAVDDVRALRTAVGERFLRWRFGGELLGYRAVHDGTTAVVVRARPRGAARELAVVGAFGDPQVVDRLAGETAKQVGCDYALRVGCAAPNRGWLPLAGAGPMLTWRAVAGHGAPPLPNWHLTLGDVELF